MARTEEKIESLVHDEPELEDAIETVLDKTDNGDEAIGWEDVKDDITSGQWGRLIQTDLLVESEGGFTIGDAEAVRDTIDDRKTVSFDDDDLEKVSWSWRDKLAGLVSLNLLAAYSFPQVRDPLANGLNIFLGPLDVALPFPAVLVFLGVVTATFSTVVQYRLIDQEKMAAFKERINKLKEWQTGNREEMEADEAQVEQMKALGAQKNMMKEQFRPMAYIMLFSIPVFLWIYWYVGGGMVAADEQAIYIPLYGVYDLTGTLGGFLPSWLLVYFVASVVFSQVIRRGFGLRPVPKDTGNEVDRG